MPDPTPEQRVAEELAREVWVGYTDEAGDDDGNYGVVDSDGRRTLSKHALNAVRAALTSDDPAVMRAMAERVGLTALAEGGALHCCCAWCCTGTPREQRGQGHAGCPS